MKNKITPMIFNELKDKYELVDIIAALSICVISTGIGLMTATTYLKGKEK